MRDVFEYTDYKAYLNETLDSGPNGGRGARGRMSEAIPCKTSYTAQVLRGPAHFSLEQGESINEFLNLTEDEGHFFLLLVQLQRAGTKKLKDRFQKQITEIRNARLLLKNRLNAKQVVPDVLSASFYSSWYYSAIHALVSLPGFKTADPIARRLGIPIKKVSEALEFLLETGLLKKGSGGFEIGNARIHLGSDSPLISKHHTNWRLQAMRSLDYVKAEDLHYSSVISVSNQDAVRIREMFVKFLQTLDPIIRDSKEEKLQSIGIDFFEV